MIRLLLGFIGAVCLITGTAYIKDDRLIAGYLLITIGSTAIGVLI